MADLDDRMAQMYLVWSLQAKWDAEDDPKWYAFIAEHWPSLLGSLKVYVKETKIACLNLKRTGIEGKELISILAALKDSQVTTELNLHDNRFEFEMKTVSRYLTKTNLKKLDISKCDLIDEDILSLLKILKNTKITELDISNNDEASFNDDISTKKFVSFLLKSHLTVLNMSGHRFYGKTGALPLIQALPTSSITDLNLSNCSLRSESLACLFSNLPASSITILDVSENEITFKKLQPIGRSLKKSKLKKLNLSGNDIGDEGVDLLAESLPFCNLISLDIGGNKIYGTNNLGNYLQNSKIEALSLCANHIQQDTIFSFPNFVKGTSVTLLDLGHCRIGDELGIELMKSLEASAVTKLVVSGNNLQLASVSEFARIIRNTVIEDIDFSSNHLSPEAILILGDSLKGSRIKHIDLNYSFNEPAGIAALATFIAKTKETSVKFINLRSNCIDVSGAEMIAANLSNTTFNHIDLSDNKISKGAVILAAQLSSTEITHLNLSSNDIHDEAAVALADCLKKTQITELKLNSNSITSLGAKALAYSVKTSSLLSLELNENKIGNDGFEALAAQTKNTFFNFFEGDMNKGEGIASQLLFTGKYFWKNRLSAHKLVCFFKQISPEMSTYNLRFDHNLDSGNVNKFLEECIHFYQTVIELPAAVSVLAEEKSLQFSKRQIATLILEFPKQFIAFVDRKIKPNVGEFMKFLKKVEGMGILEILKPLLIKPPLLKIDDSLSIIHPFFYKLLLKYDQSFCSDKIEPLNKVKVIKYLSENPVIEGALEMIGILCDEMTNSGLLHNLSRQSSKSL